MDILLNQIKRTWMPLFSLLGLFLFSSCVNEEHADEKGLSVSLTWQDPADKETEVEDVRMWVYAADGSLVSFSQQGSAAASANERFQLPQGEYRILTTTNLLPPFTFGSTTRAADPGTETRIGLQNPKVVDQNAFFGIVDVTIQNANTYTVVENPLKGVLAELALQIEGIPAGTRLMGTVKNAALWLYPMLKNSEGEYGKTSEETEEVEISMFELLDDTGQTKPVLLMPTGDKQGNSLLQLRIVLPDGTEKVSEIKAPLMKVGGKYLIQLRYDEIKTDMTLSSVKIDDWTEGWVYYGEIFDPEE